MPKDPEPDVDYLPYSVNEYPEAEQGAEQTSRFEYDKKLKEVSIQPNHVSNISTHLSTF